MSHATNAACNDTECGSVTRGIDPVLFLSASDNYCQRTMRNTRKSKEISLPVTSYVDADEYMYEQIFDSERNVCSFARCKNGALGVVDKIPGKDGIGYAPFPPGNDLLRNKVVLFPSAAEYYRSESELLQEIQSFIHRYVDVTPVFESIATYFVLLTWLHDQFKELPYLRVRGDFGSGKTRFLLVVGSLCYRPIFASGASTVAPLYHILDSMGGTLLVDEADFRYSDERADIVKILNNGNAQGFPVLRCEKVNNTEFRARSYRVFGPKIVASRNDFDDPALESRFLTEDMGVHGVRHDIPVSLPHTFAEEALSLRNKLLMFRFRSVNQYQSEEIFTDRSLELRANQTLLSLLSIVRDGEVREEIINFARAHTEQYRIDRSMQIEAHILAAIKRLRTRLPKQRTAIADIAREVNETNGKDYDRKITPKWVGYVVRKKLHLRTQKSNGVYVLADDLARDWDHLFKRFGV